MYRDTPLGLIKVVCMCQANHYLALSFRYCIVWRHTPTCTDITGCAGNELKAALEIDSKSDIEADDVCTLCTFVGYVYTDSP